MVATQGVSRRFVFLVSDVGNEVFDGADVEIRATSPEQAIEMTKDWGLVRTGAKLTLIGERVGFRSTQRFVPLAPVSHLPEHIVQNEQFAGLVPCPCKHGQCVLCDDGGMRDAESARLEALDAIIVAGWKQVG